jgi:hypothetical protein
MRKLAALTALLVSTASTAASADVRVYEADEHGPPLSLDLYGWIQPRFSYQQQDTRPGVDFTPNPAFTLQRTRLGAVVTYGEWARGQIEIELARDTAQPIDAYVVGTPLHEKNVKLNITLGQFRVPFSRQNLLPSKAYQLPDNAYFVAPKFLVDRDLGGQLDIDLFEGRGKVMVAVFNGNDPGRGQTQNVDPYFLLAGRLELSPLGAAPRFEGDLRPLEERHKPLLTLGGGAMRNHAQDKHFMRTYLGADLGFWWEGFSLYAEYYHRKDQPVDTTPDAQGVTAEGFNAQVGYFPPLPFVREHLELAFRVQRFDPDKEVPNPGGDSGARDLDQSNPTWGYLGLTFGLNGYADRGHHLKMQASYEMRNETKRCLQGQSGDTCTGFIKNNLLLLQATAAF